LRDDQQTVAARRTRGVGHPLDRLTDDLDVADDGILGLAVREERFTAIDGVAQNRVDPSIAWSG
jgi:hypothetical protein